MRLRGIAPLKILLSYFLPEYTATSIPIIPSSIPNPGVPFVEVASGVGVGSATVSESGVATGSTAPVSPTCPSIMNVENPGVGDEYWKYPPACQDFDFRCLRHHSCRVCIRCQPCDRTGGGRSGELDSTQRRISITTHLPHVRGRMNIGSGGV